MQYTKHALLLYKFSLLPCYHSLLLDKHSLLLCYHSLLLDYHSLLLCYHSLLLDILLELIDFRATLLPVIQSRPHRLIRKKQRKYGVEVSSAANDVADPRRRGGTTSGSDRVTKY